ncbi:hypothetical protein HAX54_020952, partial [Datura stramonium]|nr:hypothetical protein [Datura stramonium]
WARRRVEQPLELVLSVDAIVSLGACGNPTHESVSVEGLSLRVDQPTGLRIMSSVVSNQHMIQELSDISEPSKDCVGSPI